MSSIITRKKLFELRNTDDILLRNVTGGLLSILNSRLSYKQVWNDEVNDEESVTIPFFFNLGNPASEDFIQDNYLFFGDSCFNGKKVNGNFDMIPRGMINLSQWSIKSESATNRWVMAARQKTDPETGKFENYVSYMYAIPLEISYGVEIRCSRFGEMLKIDQACREFFYKNKTFYVLYDGMDIHCRAGFPDSFSSSNQVTQYTMGTAAQPDLKLNFQIEVESYQPVFDPSTEMKASNKIKAFGTSVEYSDNETKNKDSSQTVAFMSVVSTGIDFSGKGESAIYGIDISEGMRIPSDSTFTLTWNDLTGKKDITSVKIEYTDASNMLSDDLTHDITTQQERMNLICVTNNHGFYDWCIPQDFSGFQQPDCLIANNEMFSCLSGHEPQVRILPDISTGRVTKNDIDIVDGGYFIKTTGDEDSSADKIEGVLSWTNASTGKVEDEGVFFQIKDHKLIIPSDVSVFTADDITLNDSFTYTGKLAEKIINLYISDSTDANTYTTIRNLHII